MEKLPIGIKKAWIDALRGGDFKQGHGVLYNPSSDSYCCLGVLGSLCGFSENRLANHPWLDFEETRHLDIPEDLKSRSNNSVAFTVAEMNDRGSSFEQIADYIEQNL